MNINLNCTIYKGLSYLINVIGVIDSGTGGANVILECMKYYKEDFVFLVDNKNCPYGNKKKEDLQKILISNIEFLITNYDLDLLIIACNTLSTFVDYNLMLKYKMPILKTTPNLKLINNNGDNLLIFATKTTIKNSKEIKLLKFNYPKIKTLYIKGLPKFIDNYLINKNINNLNVITNKLNNNFYFNNKLKLKYKNIKYITLGCTHFKHIKPIIQKCLNKKITYIFCEQDVSKTSKWLIRKNKKENTVKLILTMPNEELENYIKSLF